MIRSAAEAREKMEDREEIYRNVAHVPCNFCQAVGYLDALKGPAVKGLVDALEYIRCQSNEKGGFMNEIDMVRMAENVLVEWEVLK